MCQKRNTTKIIIKSFKGMSIKVDDCLLNVVNFINTFSNYQTLGCCCGHGKYSATIIIQKTNAPMFPKLELYSMKTIPRLRKFYRRDSSGLFYIKEVLKVNVKNKKEHAKNHIS